MSQELKQQCTGIADEIGLPAEARRIIHEEASGDLERVHERLTAMLQWLPEIKAICSEHGRQAIDNGTPWGAIRQLEEWAKEMGPALLVESFRQAYQVGILGAAQHPLSVLCRNAREAFEEVMIQSKTIKEQRAAYEVRRAKVAEAESRPCPECGTSFSTVSDVDGDRFECGKCKTWRRSDGSVIEIGFVMKRAESMGLPIEKRRELARVAMGRGANFYMSMKAILDGIENGNEGPGDNSRPVEAGAANELPTNGHVFTEATL